MSDILSFDKARGCLIPHDSRETVVTSDQLRLARLRFLVAHEGLWDPLRKQKENLENQRTFTSSVTKYHKKIAKV